MGLNDRMSEADDQILLRQRRQGDWIGYVQGPDGKTTTLEPILASNLALDAAIETWERLHRKKVPSEFSFSRVPYVETMGLKGAP